MGFWRRNLEFVKNLFCKIEGCQREKNFFPEKKKVKVACGTVVHPMT